MQLTDDQHRPDRDHDAEKATGNEPAWRRIAVDMADKIASGEWAEGKRLATETQLAEQYDVNRHTLRQALKDLARRGLVEAAPRRGTFVTNTRISFPISATTSITETIEASGRTHVGRLLGSRATVAPPDMANRLEMAAQSRVIEVTQLRLANDIPLCWLTSWFPEDRAGAIVEHLNRNPSILQALSRMGIKDVRRRETTVTARSATVAERNHLELGRGATVFAVDYVDVDRAGEPTHAARAIMNAAIVELVSRNDGASR
ncbi:MAG: phosphonate metabolism transcriptional regulator PhnF [Pseudomonadota bacterium]